MHKNPYNSNILLTHFNTFIFLIYSFQIIRSIRNLLSRRGLYTESIRQVCMKSSAFTPTLSVVMMATLLLTLMCIAGKFHWMWRKWKILNDEMFLVSSLDSHLYIRVYRCFKLYYVQWNKLINKSVLFFLLFYARTSAATTDLYSLMVH